MVNTKKNPQTSCLRILKSERRGSNSRQPAWKAGALPTELLSHYCGANIENKLSSKQAFLEKKSIKNDNNL